MAVAWSQDWHELHMKQCREDKEFQDEPGVSAGSVPLQVLPDRDNGTWEENWHGFNPPQMDHVWWGEENKPAETDYLIEGTYKDWWAVNEGKKGLVASLLDQSIKLKA